MLKDYIKYAYMAKLGYKYIGIFKKTYFDPFISLKQGYKNLSLARQEYSKTVLEYLNIEVKIVGTLPQEDKILYAINHRSLLDIIVMENIFSEFDKSGVWIAKQELLDAFYGKFFEYSACMSVDLNNGKGMLKFFKELKKTLAKVDDLNVYIFPEGERYNGEGIKNFQSGAEKIAKANKLKIVPVFINDKLEKVFQEAPFEQTKVVEVHIGEIIKEGTLQENYQKLMQKAQEGK